DVEKLQAELKAVQVAVAERASFRATLNGNVTANAPIPFVTAYDVGGGYDAITGVYTVPISGAYFFYCQLFPSFLTTLNIDIMCNGNICARSRCYDKVEQSSCLSAYTAHFNAGDKVWVKPNVGGSYWGGVHSFFSGFLVSPDP
ncbi:hypothetical protein BaRGS_00002435, partial [Batillaria attramentaria]